MEVGDRLKFQFGGKEKEGVVIKVFPKKVYLKVDFPRHPGKVVIRSLTALEGKSLAGQKKKKKAKIERIKKGKLLRPEGKKVAEEKE